MNFIESNRYTITCNRVVDGDTFEGDLLIESLKIKLIDQRFRLFGIDTPERGEELYKEATDFAANLIDGKQLTASVFGRDSFGRLLTTVYLEEGTLNEELLKAKLAAPYNRK